MLCRPSKEITELRSLLQQQQSMLTEILFKQNKIEENQGEFQQKLMELDSKVPSQPSSTSDAQVLGKRKRIVSHDLTVSCYLERDRRFNLHFFKQKKVSLLHNSSEKMFNPEERYAVEIINIICVVIDCHIYL